ncbi:phosphotransferase [Rathayibacter sp. VKM Ac-2803]|uniref:phosphotransferase family protein n=1 Tax=Rathayibacter sp. VKM Ac-2803 TaxID=2609256 RepID=UPI001358E019|nr:phosphotransferase [Rathayibacter sp. VKM Ac-2803]MWV49477.1 phosphotransferase [Rathayibacter sp. VKM Ac-2803]
MIGTATPTPRTDAAVAALALRDPALPGLGALLHPDRLADALGHPVRVTRRRWKPGTEIVVAFESAEGHGWIAAWADPAKQAKTRQRAAGVGAELRELPALGALTGPVLADRALAPTLRRILEREPALLATGRILRHNPHRRLVLAEGGRVVKIVPRESADAAEGVLRVQTALAARGLPVPAPVSLLRGASSTLWWGDGDLTRPARGAEASAAVAGAALARLHAVADVPVPSGTADEIGAAAAALAALAPELGPRLERLAGAVSRSTGRSTVVHGDFSADQVLVGDGVRIIDFDRVRRDEPERDLGSFLAAEPGGSRLGDALIEAYRHAGGSIDDGVLRRRTAGAILLRAVEPFRTATPDWRERVEAELARAETVLPC